MFDPVNTANGIKQSTVTRTVVVILAAGKGTRMGRADLAKVCFDIDGVPAINRTIRTFRKLGFVNFLLVVGNNAGQVMETVGKEHPSVGYVYQSPQLGTGHAARMAADNLQALNHQGPVLVTMGDKFIEPEAVESLRDGFIRQNADLALAGINRNKASENSGGRIFLDKNSQALDIIETTDLARQAIIDEIKRRLVRGTKISTASLSKLIQKHIHQEKRQKVAVPRLFELSQNGKGEIADDKLQSIIETNGHGIQIGNRQYTAAQIEKKCTTVNPSLYYFKANAFYRGISMIANDNAQGEYYLTDVVKQLSSSFNDNQEPHKVRMIQLPDSDWIQGFNSPDELLRIQDYLRNKKNGPTAFKHKTSTTALPRQIHCTVNEWIAKIKSNLPAYRRWQIKTYGDHPDLHQSKSTALLNLLEVYGKRFDFDEKVCIVRAPGRVNLMGRHVDHRGGYNNFLAIHKETMAVVGRREDDRVVAVNMQPKQFTPVQFSISDQIGNFGWTDWLNFVNSDWVRSMLRGSAGNWGNYIKAAMLRLQHHFQDLKIDGLNMAVYGDIPIAAGLSSSSSLVVATLEAAIALNQLELNAQQFIDLCGQGEWFVGSRGGSGDHAAIYLGQRNKITQVAYLPFRIEQVIDAPSDCQVVIADSHIKAAKSGPAREQFNVKIAAYNLGMALLRQRCAEFRDHLQYVRDISPHTLGCKTSWIYRMLGRIPQSITRRELESALSVQDQELLESNFATHQDPGSYDLRGILLFGAAEVARSRICPRLLKNNQLSQFGKLMKISHDGDRVSRAGASGLYTHIPDPCTDAYLHALRGDLSSECPHKVTAAQLEMQPGYYACSTPQIDKMVDLASSVPGVIGAQIAGAGLGGCIMILTHQQAVKALSEKLRKEYYEKEKLPTSIIPCITTEGASTVSF